MNDKQLKIINLINSDLEKSINNGDFIPKLQAKKINDNLIIDKAFNYFTSKAYTGINAIILQPGFYMTALQCKKLGGRIKDGHSKNYHRIYMANTHCKVKYLIKKDDGTEEEKICSLEYFNEHKIEDNEDFIAIKDKTYFVTYSYAFIYNIDDLEGYREIKHNDLGAKTPYVFSEEKGNINDPISELIFKTYTEREKIKVFVSEDYSKYNPKDDTISIKNRKYFNSINDYYEQVFHECIHSTGNEKRLNRNSGYNSEEVVAEIGAMYSLQNIGLLTKKQYEQCKNYALGYITSNEFKEELKTNPKLLLSVFNNALLGFNYIFKGGK